LDKAGFNSWTRQDLTLGQDKALTLGQGML